MLDPLLRKAVEPSLRQAGRWLERHGVPPDGLTAVGFVVGLVCIPANALGWWWLSLISLGVNRLADGLDGAVARVRGPTDAGGYLDIVCDFIFYAGFVLGMALAAPRNAVPGAFLLFSFMGTGASFLAFAIFAAKHGISSERLGKKAFHYLGGLTEGSETMGVFVLMLLLPGAFPVLAWGYGLACWLTTAWRLWFGYQVLRAWTGADHSIGEQASSRPA